MSSGRERGAGSLSFDGGDSIPLKCHKKAAETVRTMPSPPEDATLWQPKDMLEAARRSLRASEDPQ